MRHPARYAARRAIRQASRRTGALGALWRGFAWLCSLILFVVLLNALISHM